MTDPRYAQARDDVFTVLERRVVWLSVSQFAQVSSLHPDTVRKFCAAGELPCRQLRRNAPYSIHYTQLVDFFDKHNKGAA